MSEVEERVIYLLNCVGLARNQRNRYPHEFSGGQRQRVGIARAPIINPPAGCRFCSRCFKGFEPCHLNSPGLKEVSPNHWVACHLFK
ncbi:Oligopeptide transport ATP-binding protein OppF [Desulfosporosinus sp. BG]|nr:Oligopeptide transport ATP-binding protein OppF [Desulfosporosinus sp. BG]